MVVLQVILLLLFSDICFCGELTIEESEFQKEFLKLSNKLQSSDSPISRSGVSTDERYKIFRKRYVKIKELNAENRRFTAVSNEFAMMTDRELKQYRGLNITFYKRREWAPRDGFVRNSKAPQAVNWKDQGKVTEIKAQGNCGSCWAFAAVATLESHYAIQGGTLKLMSEQHVLDCTYLDQGYDGCQGGWMSDAYKQIRNKLGNKLATSESYGYEAVAAKSCPDSDFDNALVAANIDDGVFTSVPFNDDESSSPYEKNLASAVSIGPVAVAIEVVNSLYTYGSGVYDEKNCKTQVNHAVTVVGYDQATFLIKNSWGSAWGDKGYVSFDRSISNQCFIGSYPEYPNMKLTGNEEGQDEETDVCAPSPCQNNGVCSVAADGNYSCKCKNKFTGSQCQNKVNKCKDRSKRCPKDKNDRKCLAGKAFVKRRCKLSCGFCYL